MNTYRELLGKLNELTREIELAREREAQLLAARVLEVLAENGVDVRDLLKSSPGGKRSARRFVPKYLNPVTGATWSGRGRKPAWLIGQDLEKFLIPDAGDRP
ncbi:H-NS family DNA-binding protein [Paraburkholderia phenazinium]|jgi:DNA-binding protein H-NS|uniref:H-NS family DNA-binding protein n=1 Tax=Paraburkholderia phenazinium TaxID=60549 RepID=A0A1G8HH97_9BURK|nr:H-NS histone family protein [Paraburkholderia phenazinium]SDI06028.1 H-NS family DNA-binding protein [Paraburkholderia phenazinium]